MIIIDRKISKDELREMQDHFFGDMVKAVVDLKRGVIALDSELHADLESLLLEDGSVQWDLWGINLYPDAPSQDEYIEFDSIINIRPHQDNPSRFVMNPEVRESIAALVNDLIEDVSA